MKAALYHVLLTITWSLPVVTLFSGSAYLAAKYPYLIVVLTPVAIYGAGATTRAIVRRDV